MLQFVTEVRHAGGHRLWLRFEDGVEGVVDLGQDLSFQGVFEPLRDERYFAQVKVDPDCGTIVWPNGVDLDPDVLHSQVSGRPLPGIGA